MLHISRRFVRILNSADISTVSAAAALMYLLR